MGPVTQGEASVTESARRATDNAVKSYLVAVDVMSSGCANKRFWKAHSRDPYLPARASHISCYCSSIIYCPNHLKF